MAAYVTFGDAEAAVCAILRDSDQVAAFDGVTVSTDLIGYATGGRWIRVVRTGGVPTLWMRLDNPVITIDVYAEDKSTAHDIADAARAALFAACGLYAGFGLALFDVGNSVGLSWATDEPNAAHYTLSVALVTRPN